MESHVGPVQRPEDQLLAVYELADGTLIDIRRISHADAPLLAAFHEGLSERTVYQRFFAPHPHLSDQDLEYFTSVDHLNREALVAIDAGRVIGVARFDVMDNGRAEIAFVIDDDYQGRGIGSELLDLLIVRGRNRGVTTFVAETLVGNAAMLRLLTGRGLPHHEHSDQGVVQVIMELGPARGERMSP